jgi:hypothetical protein
VCTIAISFHFFSFLLISSDFFRFPGAGLVCWAAAARTASSQPSHTGIPCLFHIVLVGFVMEGL